MTGAEMYICHSEVLTEVSLSVNVSTLGVCTVSKAMAIAALVFLHS